ncbi:MAG: PQQ-dependent sugar dehydrogenase [Chitinophagaceae bacterium]|nr:PQQ-dependent sugar dehydrogenase [Chitinophagaceae bacterium]
MRSRTLLFFITAISLSSFSFCQPKISLEPHPIVINKDLAFTLQIPQGYGISVAAKGLKRPRFFSKSPDGRIFITDMYDRSDNRNGRVLILENWNDSAKRFEKTTTFLQNLHNPNQVAFYQVKDQHRIYVAETGRLSYYQYNPGDSTPISSPIVIATFPDYGLSYKYGGWHLTRSISFHNNKMYVSVGSSCDACIEKEEVRATIIEMDPDGSNQRIYARGLRNSVGMKWIDGRLWVTSMGRDNRGPDQPEELLHTVQPGVFYGWPYYYQHRQRIITDEVFKDSARQNWVQKPPVSPWAFAAHTAPLGFDHFAGFSDTVLNNSFVVALHGSTSVWRQRGNSVVRVTKRGRPEEIITGFLQGRTENKRFGRPCDVMQWDSVSFFVSDDKNGVVYYVWKW